MNSAWASRGGVLGGPTRAARPAAFKVSKTSRFYVAKADRSGVSRLTSAQRRCLILFGPQGCAKIKISVFSLNVRSGAGVASGHVQQDVPWPSPSQRPAHPSEQLARFSHGLHDWRTPEPSWCWLSQCRGPLPTSGGLTTLADMAARASFLRIDRRLATPLSTRPWCSSRCQRCAPGCHARLVEELR